MRTSVITRFAKNTRSLSTRRGLAAVATTVVLAGGVQILATDTAWACAGPYQANNPTISEEAQARHHDGAPVAGFVAPAPASLTAGSSAELGVEFGNFTGADYDEAAPSLTLLSPSGVANRPLLKYLTVEAMHDGSWKQLTIDNGCLGEAIRVDTSPLLQHLANGRASRVTFRVSLAADAPKELASLSITTSAWAEVSGTGKSASTTVKIRHTPAEPAATPTAEPTRSGKPAPGKTAKPAKPAHEAQSAADETKAATQALKSPEPKATSAAPSAPATTAPAGTPELAQTGSSSANTFLAGSAAALLALGAGVLIAVRRLRPRR
ncbi:LAETG motif-containing sortase-dependent surface protein [Streptomyces sp. SP17BM10]|uniref:LAETG motif-containing sortase-dependent surface protein n=1 Tax=Streptomyces sp. SP17BM10 TaxID=3002530 RepID=UPI002E7715F1|nr:LAETG motif-containing sortase-dependent surface protein [Streptomyces sp. SP17BM10]MEE1788150.1 LAETG motif-containing sortase-dependent surface protein [Streptomyces sp. SP17BM10]